MIAMLDIMAREASPSSRSRTRPGTFGGRQGPPRPWNVPDAALAAQMGHLVAGLAAGVREGCPVAQAEIRRLMRWAEEGDPWAAEMLNAIIALAGESP